MENKKLGQNEPAFPTDVGYSGNQIQELFQTGNEQAHCSGMSKRFYAACAAMQGILASPNEFKVTETETSGKNAENKIKLAYILADELLKQENL